MPEESVSHQKSPLEILFHSIMGHFSSPPCICFFMLYPLQKYIKGKRKGGNSLIGLNFYKYSYRDGEDAGEAVHSGQGM